MMFLSQSGLFRTFLEHSIQKKCVQEVYGVWRQSCNAVRHHEPPGLLWIRNLLWRNNHINRIAICQYDHRTCPQVFRIEADSFTRGWWKLMGDPVTFLLKLSNWNSYPSPHQTKSWILITGDGTARWSKSKVPRCTQRKNTCLQLLMSREHVKAYNWKVLLANCATAKSHFVWICRICLWAFNLNSISVFQESSCIAPFSARVLTSMSLLEYILHVIQTSCFQFACHAKVTEVLHDPFPNSHPSSRTSDTVFMSLHFASHHKRKLRISCKHFQIKTKGISWIFHIYSL